MRRSLPLRRLAAVAVLAVVAALYVAPVEKYFRVQRDLHRQQAALSAAKQRHALLLRESQALQTDGRIIVLARQCGWIFPGERALVVEGLPGSASTHCS